MKRQIPPIVFYGIAAVALMSAVTLLTKPGNPELHKGSLMDQPAPAIEGKTADGKQVSLADYKGKVVLVNFWATWCGPCRKELPSVVALHKKYAARGLEVIGMVSNDDLTQATQFAKDNEMNWPQLNVTPELGMAYGIRAIPATFIVGRDGKIAATIDGLVEPSVLEAEVQAHL
jgi:peroxiredoxin